MASKETLEFEVKSDIGKTAKEMETLSDNTKEATDRNKDLNKSTGSGVIGFKNLRNIVAALGTAFKALGVGLLITLFTSLGNVFRQNQKVLDFFNIAMESLSMAFNDLFNFIDNNIGTVKGHLKALFTDPFGELYKLGQGIQTFFIDNLGGVIDFIGSLGKLMATNPITNPKLFAKNLAAVGLAALDAKKDIKIAFDEITESVTNYTKGIIDGAKATVSLRKESELAAVMVQGIIEDYDRQAEKLRQVRDDESKTFEERIAANNKLGEVLKEQEKEMLKLVDIQIASAQADVNKNDNLANQIALQQALNEKKGVLAQITGFESEQLVNNISLQKEQKLVAEENAAAQLAAFSQLAGGLAALAGGNKELAVAGAIIDTYAGATKAFAQGGVAGFVSGAAIIAAGFANIQKIMSTPIPGSEGGSAGEGTAQTPAPEMMSGSFEMPNLQGNKPIQAFVVSDQITDSQDGLAIIRRRATI